MIILYTDWFHDIYTIRSAVTITKEHRQLQVIDLDELACSAEVSMIGS